MKKLFIMLSVTILIVTTISILLLKNYIRIGDNYYKIEISNTDKERTLGLSYRESLKNDSGMLFVHDKEGVYPYWMYEMKFPLDMVFLDKDFKIVDYYQNAIPCESEKNCITISSRKPFKFVLELKSGFVKEKGLKIGDKLETNFLTFVP